MQTYCKSTEKIPLTTVLTLADWTKDLEPLGVHFSDGEQLTSWSNNDRLVPPPGPLMSTSWSNKAHLLAY